MTYGHTFGLLGLLSAIATKNNFLTTVLFQKSEGLSDKQAAGGCDNICLARSLESHWYLLWTNTVSSNYLRKYLSNSYSCFQLDTSLCLDSALFSLMLGWSGRLNSRFKDTFKWMFDRRMFDLRLTSSTHLLQSVSSQQQVQSHSLQHHQFYLQCCWSLLHNQQLPSSLVSSWLIFLHLLQDN